MRGCRTSVLCVAALKLDMQARRAVVLDNRALGSLPCPAQRGGRPQRDKKIAKLLRQWPGGTQQAVCVRAGVTSNILCTPRPTKAQTVALLIPPPRRHDSHCPHRSPPLSEALIPSSESETDGKAPGGGADCCEAASRVAALEAAWRASRQRGAVMSRRCARLHARRRGPPPRWWRRSRARCTCLPSRTARAWYREQTFFTPL